jgi:2-dehydro-3-deoxygalactonokinase
MEMFISCDWGVSALRLRLVDEKDLSVLSETESVNGILHTHDLWKKSGGNPQSRVPFYQAVLASQVKKLETGKIRSLEKVPLIISGMASSNIGMRELPYKQTPFRADGLDLQTEIIETNSSDHMMLVISGACTGEDLMRGEETQLIGCSGETDLGEEFFIFPGTHSKHVLVKDGSVVDIRTYMTGEFFELLSMKSILSGDVVAGKHAFNPGFSKNFKDGVVDSVESNLLHSVFSVRIKSLLGKQTKEENYYYLSGLLIGTELRELLTAEARYTIVADELLGEYYMGAFSQLGLNSVKSVDSARATIRGQYQVYKMSGLRKNN